MNRRYPVFWICGLLCSIVPVIVPVHEVSANEPPVVAVSFAPDGNSVVAVSQAGVQVFSWPELERQTTLPASAANLHCLAFSPDGMQLAVGGGDPSVAGGVEVFAWPSGKPVSRLDGHDDSVRSVAWMDNDTLLTASIDREIQVWDVTKKSSVLNLKGHSRGVDAICLLENGRTLVSTGTDQSLRVWSLESGELLRSLNQHTKPVHALAARPNAEGLPLVASAAGDRTIRFWQPTIGRMVRYVRLEAEPLNIAWLPGGSRAVACCVDGRIYVIDTEEVKVVRTLPAIQGWAYAIAVHPEDGSIVVGGSEGQVRRVVIDASK